MTPSEIAEALEARHKYDKINYPPASPLDRQAAATIRELEARALQAEEGAEMWEQGFAGSQAKLKIATEALESVNVDASALCRSAIDAPEAVYEIGLTATQALARIKETK